MTKPIIGIAGNERIMLDHDAHEISYIPKNFINGVQAAGGLPLILPIGEPAIAKDYIQQIDKLILVGGHDVTPKNYGHHPHQRLGETNPARDAFELALITAATEQGKPILGVCRGMQLLNVAFGGTLIQDLSLRETTTFKHVQLPTPFSVPTHFVHLQEDFAFRSFLPETYEVNSFHHQVVDRLGDDFFVAAKAEDGVVEAIQSKSRPIIGVQWHPELTRETIPSEQQIFTYFVQQYH